MSGGGSKAGNLNPVSPNADRSRLGLHALNCCVRPREILRYVPPAGAGAELTITVALSVQYTFPHAEGYGLETKPPRSAPGGGGGGVRPRARSCRSAESRT